MIGNGGRGGENGHGSIVQRQSKPDSSAKPESSIALAGVFGGRGAGPRLSLHVRALPIVQGAHVATLKRITQTAPAAVEIDKSRPFWK